MKDKVKNEHVSLKAADRLTFTLDGATHGNPLGVSSAAADPTSAFVSGVAVKIGGVELPCLLYTFKGKDQDGAELSQSDCISPFARVPLYSEHQMTIIGITAKDYFTAQGLEAPVKVGKKTVLAMTRKGKQKLSNGGGSEITEVLSADVPGGLVRSEWKPVGENLGDTTEALDFGDK